MKWLKKYNKICRKCHHYNECDGSKKQCHKWQRYDICNLEYSIIMHGKNHG